MDQEMDSAAERQKPTNKEQGRYSIRVRYQVEAHARLCFLEQLCVRIIKSKGTGIQGAKSAQPPIPP